MSTTQDTPATAQRDRAERTEREQDERLQYEPPRIDSSDVFHTVSNGPVPGYCGGYGG